VSVFRYDDYREFLKDWFWERKLSDPGFSFRTISKALGLRAPNHFHLVISKKRHLSEELLQKLLPMVALDDAGEQFLEALYAVDHAASERCLQKAKRLIQALRRCADADTQLVQESEPVFATHSLAWYIKSSSQFFSNKTVEEIIEYLLLHCPFAVERPSIEAALDLLCRVGVLHFHGGQAIFDPEAHAKELKLSREHQMQNLKLAMLSSTLGDDLQFFSSVTLPCSQSFFTQLVADIRSMSVSMLEQANERVIGDGDSENVLTLQFSLFPFLRSAPDDASVSRSRPAKEHSLDL
jgi:uncharacterized protein (TIGR02147 family)